MTEDMGNILESQQAVKLNQLKKNNLITYNQTSTFFSEKLTQNCCRRAV